GGVYSTGNGLAQQQDANIPILGFSSNDSAGAGSDDNDIKDYWRGEATAGDDYSTAYFNLAPGSMAGYIDSNGDPIDADNLLEDVMGCAFMVPMGDSSVAKHEFDISLLMSQEHTSDSSQSNAEVHVTLWKAQVGDSFTVGGASSIKFRLVKKTLLTPSGEYVKLPNASQSTKHQTTQTFDVPLYSSSTDWSGRMCFYILGCWVSPPIGNSIANLLTPDASAQNWPTYAGVASNNGKGSIKAFVNVTYQRITPS
ncbi:MAG: hypothetical protein ACKVJ2_13345, partial [Pseudomonadales bacterium]